MKPTHRSSRSTRSPWILLALWMGLGSGLAPGRAEPPPLRILWVEGHRGIVPSPTDAFLARDGTVLVNNDIEFGGGFHVLQSDGQLFFKFLPQPLANEGVPDRKVRQVLGDRHGSFLVSVLKEGIDSGNEIWRRRLDGSWGPVENQGNVHIPPGPCLAHPEGGVVCAPEVGTSPGSVPLLRFDLAPEEAAGGPLVSNRMFQTHMETHAAGMRAVSSAITPEGKIWAWLVPFDAPRITRPRLERFLSDGRPDPTFTHLPRWQTGETNWGEIQPFPWLGVLPDDRVLTMVWKPQDQTLALIRLLPDGREDAAFNLSPTNFHQGFHGSFYPLLALPDGGFLVSAPEVWSGSQDLPRRIAPDGRLDLMWKADLPRVSMHHFARQTDGRMVVIYGNPGSRGPRPNLTRLHPDGSRDRSFDPSQGGATARSVRLLAEGMRPGRTYEVLRGFGAGSFELLNGRLSILEGTRHPVDLGVEFDFSWLWGRTELITVREVGSP